MKAFFSQIKILFKKKWLIAVICGVSAFAIVLTGFLIWRSSIKKEAIATGRSGIVTTEDRNVIQKVIRPTIAPKEVKFIDHKAVGGWINAREGDSKIGPHLSYDGNSATLWNPQANGNYKGDPAIVYLMSHYNDLQKITLTFGKREYFFKLLVSINGEDFTEVVEVGKENFSQYYSDLIFTVDNINQKEIGYIKIIFTGSNSDDNNSWVSLMEIDYEGTSLREGPKVIPEQPEEKSALPKVQKAIISSNKVIGTWVNDRAGTPSLGSANTYDDNIFTRWNPQAKSGYKGEPGIIYTLDKAYDLKQIVLAFDGSPHYFDLLVSSDGKKYDKIAAISKVNEALAYSGLVCTLDGLKTSKVKYVKIVFTGRNGNGTWVAFSEIVMSEEGSAPKNNSWMLQTVVPPVKGTASIVKADVGGSWEKDNVNHVKNSLDKSFDNDLTTMWNPQAKSGYAGGPSVTYGLDKAYDIKKMVLTVGNTMHYFDVYSSSDGKNFTKLASISPLNETKAYTGLVCTLDGLDSKNVKFVKIVFTGRKGNSTWVALMEVAFHTEGINSADNSWMLPFPEKPTENVLTIQSAKSSGSWINDRSNLELLGIHKSIDKNTSTYWNPQAKSGYTDSPGAVYALDGYFDLDEIKVVTANREYFYDVYVSTYGDSYNKVGQVNASNMKSVYQGFISTLKLSANTQVKYVKLVLTGSNSHDNNTWVSLVEVELTGKVSPTQPEPPKPPMKPDVKIKSYLVEGDWVNDRVADNGSEEANMGPSKSYDNDDSTMWNPNAKTGFAGNPAIVYTLDKAYDIKKVKLNFYGSVHYFQIYVSSDGQNFTKLADIMPENQEKAYDGIIATLDGLQTSNITHAKVVFTGRAGSTWIGLNEIAFYTTGSEPGDNSWMLPEPEVPDPNKLTIFDSEISGAWDNENLSGLVKSRDSDKTSHWNPKAATGYAGMPGAIYTLDNHYDIEKIVLTFGSREYYFDIYAGASKDNLTRIAQITSENHNDSYKGLVSTLGSLDVKNVKYVKVVFTGSRSGDNTPWVSLMEIEISGVKSETPVEPDPTIDALITGHNILGEWSKDQASSVTVNPSKSYDKELSTHWNPEVKAGFAGNPAILYTLNDYYDLGKTKLTFGSRVGYFNMLVSSDNLNFTSAAQVTLDNYNDHYQDLICTVDLTGFKEVKYIKIVFTGAASTWLSLKEIEVRGVKVDAPVMPEPVVDIEITGHIISGTWKNDRSNTPSLGPANSYDGNLTNNWNPEGNAGYSGSPGIIYTFDKYYDLDSIKLTFGTRIHYFNLFVSADNENYHLIAQINASNASTYFDGTNFLISLLDSKQIKYFKIVFTGNAASGNTFVSLREVECRGKKAEMPSVKAAIVSGQIVGEWTKSQSESTTVSPAKSYDGNLSTHWNPEVKSGYSGNPGIVYALDGIYALDEVKLVFGSRVYYFDLYISSDGENFVRKIQVTSSNYADYFSDYVCTIPFDDDTGTKYVQVIFTGAASTWVSLKEVEVKGKPNADEVSDLVAGQSFSKDLNLFPVAGIVVGTCGLKLKKRKSEKSPEKQTE